MRGARIHPGRYPVRARLQRPPLGFGRPMVRGKGPRACPGSCRPSLRPSLHASGSPGRVGDSRGPPRLLGALMRRSGPGSLGAVTALRPVYLRAESHSGNAGPLRPTDGRRAALPGLCARSARVPRFFPAAGLEVPGIGSGLRPAGVALGSARRSVAPTGGLCSRPPGPSARPRHPARYKSSRWITRLRCTRISHPWLLNSYTFAPAS